MPPCGPGASHSLSHEKCSRPPDQPMSHVPLRYSGNTVEAVPHRPDRSFAEGALHVQLPSALHVPANADISGLSLQV